MIDIIKREKPKKILWITPNENLRDVEIPNEFITWKAKTYLNKTKWKGILGVCLQTDS